MSIRVEQRRWTTKDGWAVTHPGTGVSAPQLVLAFGGGGALSDATRAAELRAAYPGAPIVGCSTSGEICGTEVLDDSIVATALQFEHTTIRTVLAPLVDASASDEIGRAHV